MTGKVSQEAEFIAEAVPPLPDRLQLSSEQIDALFQSMDPAGSGFISLETIVKSLFSPQPQFSYDSDSSDAEKETELSPAQVRPSSSSSRSRECA
jgi:hypothetical protein